MKRVVGLVFSEENNSHKAIQRQFTAIKLDVDYIFRLNLYKYNFSLDSFQELQS